MRIDVLGLQAFVTIADRGSFHAAAAHLNLSQTALSHRIRKLEEGLSVALLLRTTRQVTLTPAGVALLPAARRIFEDLGEALGDLQAQHGQVGSQVTFACLPTIAQQYLPAVIAEFAAAFPKTAVRVIDVSMTEVAAKVQSGDAEFGVTILAANRWDFEARPILREPFVLVCHRLSPVAGEAALTWAQLDGLPLIRISAETGNRLLVDDALGSRRETMQWRYEVQRLPTAIALVSSGVGCAIVPQRAVDLARNDEIRAVPLRSPSVFRQIGIVSLKGVPLSAPAKHLTKLIAKSLKADAQRLRSEDS